MSDDAVEVNFQELPLSDLTYRPSACLHPKNASNSMLVWHFMAREATLD